MRSRFKTDVFLIDLFSTSVINYSAVNLYDYSNFKSVTFIMNVDKDGMPVEICKGSLDKINSEQFLSKS